MVCPECGEAMAPGPLDRRRIAYVPGSMLERVARRLGRLHAADAR